ncbi:MAG: 30S ribosomal protein S14 [Candidatus Nanoarchaeia archaeon]|nr:30S ribosomal protein S14 [Candidatus Nanoarchaeia archaeon]
MKHNAPKDRKHGRSTLRCKRCGRIGAHIGKYNIHLCRQCFREIASSMGFRKFS